LYGKLTKKHQPDYKLAMKAVPAEELYHQFLDMLKSNYEEEKIKDGVFGAMMDVALVNDGPVTIVIESEPKAPDEVVVAEASVDDEKS
jgi:D-tyrosyl-tRNA(Tyr) deacylase